MAIDETQFRNAMSHFPSGVTVVTTLSAGERFGMTVASFASLSLRPPLVVICIEKGVRTHDALEVAGKFAVNILAAGQEEISRIFASRSETKFAQVSVTTGALGLPLIEGALASVECRTVDAYSGGDHTIFIGEVVEAQTREGNPLLYFRSGYRELR